MAGPICQHTTRRLVSYLTFTSGLLVASLMGFEFFNQKHRTFPSNMPLVFATISFLFTCSLGAGPFVRESIDDAIANAVDSEDGWFWLNQICKAQAFFYQTLGFMLLTWYVMLTEILYQVIVLNVKLESLNPRRYYVIGTVVPLFTGLMGAVVADGYGPRSGGFECWTDSPIMQFSLLYFWIFASMFFGVHRSYRIVWVLKKTNYKTKKNARRQLVKSSSSTLSSSSAAAEDDRPAPPQSTGPTPQSTRVGILKEMMLRQVAFILVFIIFCVINLFYFGVSSGIRISKDGIFGGGMVEDPENGFWVDDNDDPCALQLLYAVNISTIGIYVTLVFGVTRENLQSLKTLREKGWAKFFGSSANNNTSTEATEEELETSSEIWAPENAASGGAGKATPKPKVVVSSNDLTAPLMPNVESPVQSRQPKTVEKAQPETAVTYLGTEIPLSFNKPINAGALNCNSAYNMNAVSVISVPPQNHPMTAKVEQMRVRYTMEVLSYARERMEVMEAELEGLGWFDDPDGSDSDDDDAQSGVKGGLITKFMSGVETDADSFFDLSINEDEDDYSDGDLDQSEGGGRSRFESNDSYAAIPTEEDIDAKLAIAKRRFDEIVKKKKTKIILLQQGGGGARVPLDDVV